MATLLDQDFRARLRALADKYAASVPGAMQAIRVALELCQQEGPLPQHLTLLHERLHMVAGSAGTFGFTALGQECRRLEQQLRLMMEGDAAAGWDRLMREVAQLLRWAAVDPAAATYVLLSYE